MRQKLDHLDYHILNILQEDGRITNSKLAEQVGLSAPPMSERVKKLERSGLIKGYRAILDHEALGRSFAAYVAINVDVKQLNYVSDLESRLRELEEVVECYHIAGGIDFLLKVQVESQEGYKRFVVDRLSHIEGLNKIHTWVVLSTVKEGAAVPLTPQED
ncbi:MAG: Lrp/AsnC family transcriptional regulator [Acidobacteria bacterium]|nr:Lrp/AsnC family transcriptional regulator [Acidobacteriota bacterium]